MDNGRKELVFLKILVHIFAINIMIFWFVCLFSFDLLIIMLFYSKQNNNKKELGSTIKKILLGVVFSFKSARVK